ncbi:MAG TPA: Rieske 2Fe-2S domain-containing protein [Thermoanaerobaculia bacterium]|nr:Rieske 2Fe-2S domain-containing protein [Thermoanaerobaculia bacterium]
MSDFIDAGSAHELPVGRAKLVATAGTRLVLCHTKDGFFALDNTCPHRGGPLHEGDVIGNEIVCPWHLWGFDVSTGLCGGNTDLSVSTHEVRIAGDRILVKP